MNDFLEELMEHWTNSFVAEIKDLWEESFMRDLLKEPELFRFWVEGMIEATEKILKEQSDGDRYMSAWSGFKVSTRHAVQTVVSALDNIAFMTPGLKGASLTVQEAMRNMRDAFQKGRVNFLKDSNT